MKSVTTTLLLIAALSFLTCSKDEVKMGTITFTNITHGPVQLEAVSTAGTTSEYMTPGESKGITGPIDLSVTYTGTDLNEDDPANRYWTQTLKFATIPQQIDFSMGPDVFFLRVDNRTNNSYYITVKSPTTNHTSGQGVSNNMTTEHGYYHTFGDVEIEFKLDYFSEPDFTRRSGTDFTFPMTANQVVTLVIN